MKKILDQLKEKYQRYLTENGILGIPLTDYRSFEGLAFRSDARPPILNYELMYGEIKRKGIFDIGFKPQNQSFEPYCGYIAPSQNYTPYAEYNISASFQFGVSAWFPLDHKKSETWIYITRPQMCFPTYELQIAAEMPSRNVLFQEFAAPEIPGEHILGAIRCTRHYYIDPYSLFKENKIQKTHRMLHLFITSI